MQKLLYYRLQTLSEYIYKCSIIIFNDFLTYRLIGTQMTYDYVDPSTIKNHISYVNQKKKKRTMQFFKSNERLKTLQKNSLKVF